MYLFFYHNRFKARDLKNDRRDEFNNKNEFRSCTEQLPRFIFMLTRLKYRFRLLRVQSTSLTFVGKTGQTAADTSLDLYFYIRQRLIIKYRIRFKYIFFFFF